MKSFLKSFFRNLIFALLITLLLHIAMAGFDPSFKTGWSSLPDDEPIVPDGCNPAKFSIVGFPVGFGLECGDFSKTPEISWFVVIFVLSLLLVSFTTWIIKKLKKNEIIRPSP